jgi:hypothetical protein
MKGGAEDGCRGLDRCVQVSIRSLRSGLDTLAALALDLQLDLQLDLRLLLAPLLGFE